MEVLDVVHVEGRGGQVAAATEPPDAPIRLEVPVVEVHRRRLGGQEVRVRLRVRVRVRLGPTLAGCVVSVIRVSRARALPKAEAGAGAEVRVQGPGAGAG